VRSNLNIPWHIELHQLHFGFKSGLQLVQVQVQSFHRNLVSCIIVTLSASSRTRTQECMLRSAP
jgi:hypothetical protein